MTTTESTFDPIFVHASPRSGSTYFFNVLRRDASLLCFNEAIGHGKGRFRSRRTNVDLSVQQSSMNHRFLERNDFDEFADARDAVEHLFPNHHWFKDYLPPQGVLSPELKAYLAALMRYARSRGKRPVLCEIYSRGRAAALRDTFGGFHIAQYRDPLSQFGSFFRLLPERGWWVFLAFPLRELGISGAHPLYRLVPEAWRLPVLPWPADDRAHSWASDVQYMSMVASPRPDAVEKALRWHLFSWTLSNLAAVSYSDLALDIDKTHDDAAYRATVVNRLAGAGVVADLRDLEKFDRYYEFESFDIAAVCGEVAATIRECAKDGRLDDALCTLGRQAPLMPAAAAAELLLAKMQESLVAMTTSANRVRVSSREWKAIVERHRKLWFNPNVRRFAQRIYPVAAPLLRVARRVGVWA